MPARLHHTDRDPISEPSSSLGLHRAPIETPSDSPSATGGDLLVRFRAELVERIGEKNYANWFEAKASLRLDGARLTVAIGSPFLLKWMNRHFRTPATQAACASLGPSAELDFVVEANADATSSVGAKTGASSNDVETSRDERAGKSDTDASATAKSAPAAALKPEASELRRRFADLAELVVGGGNELAVMAGRQVIEQPGRHYNPLYIHGGVGLGKTHLLEGLHRAIRRRHPGLAVSYLTAESFGNHFSHALRTHGLPSFRQKFRSVDVLLVDDVQFLDGKRGFQSEFLHTFQTLAQAGKQVVIAGDRHPKLLSQLSDELITRFVSGLVCRVEAPDAETRRKIAEAKATRFADVLPGGVLTEGTVEYVASRFTRSVRELEGAINCLATHARLLGKPITTTIARRVLSSLERDCARVIKLADVEETVSEFFGVTGEDLKSGSRKKQVTQPRAIAMFLSRELLGTSYREIGRHYGGRNHSTVVAAEKKVREWTAGGQPVVIASREWDCQTLLETLREKLA